MKVWAIVVLVVLHLLLGGVGLGCVARAVRNWRQFRAGRGRALLDLVDDEELQALPVVWPLREQRWPEPVPGHGDPMSPERASAYARLADQTASSRQQAVFILGTLGGAWIGVTLPVIWNDTKALANIFIPPTTGNYPIEQVLHRILFMALHLISLVPIMIAYTLNQVVRDYAEVRDLYLAAADPGEAAEQVKTQLPMGHSGLRAWLRRQLT